MKIYAEREFASSQFANCSDTRSGLLPTLTLSRIEHLFHVRIPFQQFTKPGLNDDRNPKIWSPFFQELKGGGEKNDVPDGPKANNQNPCLVRKVREN